VKGCYTLSSSVPYNGHFTLVVCDSEGKTVGEVHLKRPIPKTPSQYAGEMYMWDTEDVVAINSVKHPGPVMSISAIDRATNRAMRVYPSDTKPKAPSGVNGHLKEWREYFNS